MYFLCTVLYIHLFACNFHFALGGKSLDYGESNWIEPLYSESADCVELSSMPERLSSTFHSHNHQIIQTPNLKIQYSNPIPSHPIPTTAYRRPAAPETRLTNSPQCGLSTVGSAA